MSKSDSCLSPPPFPLSTPGPSSPLRKNTSLPPSFCQQHFCYSLPAFIAGASFPFCLLFLSSTHLSDGLRFLCFHGSCPCLGDRAGARVLPRLYAPRQAAEVTTYVEAPAHSTAQCICIFKFSCQPLAVPAATRSALASTLFCHASFFVFYFFIYFHSSLRSSVSFFEHGIIFHEGIYLNVCVLCLGQPW